MKKLVCDICGGELTPRDYYSSFKLKKEDKNILNPGWIRLDVHVGCWQELCKEISKRRRHE